MTVLKGMDSILEISHHGARAWTFQELLLSQRTLTFLPTGSIFFRCLRAQWSEEDTNELRPEETTWEPDHLYSALDENYTTLAFFDAIVVHYTKCTLSFQADGHRALYGLENLIQRDFGCAFLQKRTWIRWYYRTPEGGLKQVLSNEDTVEVPFTRPHATYGVQRGFDNKHCPDIDVSSTLPIKSAPINLDKDRIIQFWTRSLTLSISAVISSPHGPDVCSRGTIVDATGNFCGSVHFADNFIKEARECEFIVLSEACDAMAGSAIEHRMVPDKSRWDMYWVMLITWDAAGTYAERRGTGQIFQKAAQTSLAPGPVWKEIVLV
ncbi:hypothetical protein BU16DRAFT_620906 [Lophium mytilinum]|uniref:Heterokaryon incompatibility domain-containing protein n=1 Tax=Lophium mytilinum TaxID=390894 RepID=A0A6A6QH01_9PEZI|nr:hypothetical protein BU16DRAFT_620906 [Lophium mytilinum]